jgi:GT2 family glycosyltransferase
MGRNRNSMDITILTCNYNTPKLIVNMLKSVKQTCSEIPNLVVMNTSTEESDILHVNKIPYFNYENRTL